MPQTHLRNWSQIIRSGELAIVKTYTFLITGQKKGAAMAAEKNNVDGNVVVRGIAGSLTETESSNSPI